jgi:20S proteasome alpha/beta subunit
MTTIAFDGRYIACDSRTSGGTYIYSDEYIKHHDTGDHVVFLAGQICDKQWFLNSWQESCKNERECEAGAFVFCKKNWKDFRCRL